MRFMLNRKRGSGVLPEPSYIYSVLLSPSQVSVDTVLVEDSDTLQGAIPYGEASRNER